MNKMIVGTVAEEHLPCLNAPTSTQLQSIAAMRKWSQCCKIIQVYRSSQKFGFSFEISKM